MVADWWARGLAGASLATAVGLEVWRDRRSKPRLRVRIRLLRHRFDPAQHSVLVTYWNAGSIPVEVRGVGVKEVKRSGTEAQLGHMELQVSDRVETLQPHKPPKEIRVSMKAIVDRWYPDAHLELRAWVQGPLNRTYSTFVRPLAFRTPKLDAE